MTSSSFGIVADQIIQASRLASSSDPQVLMLLEAILNKLSEQNQPAPAQVNPEVLTTKQVAVVLGVSERTVETLVASGELQPIRIRGSRRFSKATVDAYLNSLSKKKHR